MRSGNTPIGEARNIMQLNTTLNKAGAAMDALTKEADSSGIDLRHDADGIESALIDFFTDRDAREPASAVLRAGI